MPYMYILKCCDDTYYTGSTWSLEKRLEKHNAGDGSNYTSKRLPVELEYYECFDEIGEAFKREKQVQNWSRKKKQALMAGNHHQLEDLAKKDFLKI